MGFFDAVRLYGMVSNQYSCHTIAHSHCQDGSSYSQVLNDTLESRISPYDGLAMTHRMWNKTFSSIGTNIAVSPKGDRIYDFYLLSFDQASAQFVVRSIRQKCINALIPNKEFVNGFLLSAGHGVHSLQ